MSRLPSIVGLVSLVLLTAVAPLQNRNTRGNESEAISGMLRRLHDNGEFTGNVLVARAGVPIYRETIARTADEARELAAPSNIASVAKCFTAMAVMMLAEQGKVKYDDPIDKHLPDLAGAAPGITIRHLLTHTSGIPDVGDLGIDRPNLAEADVVEAIRVNHARFTKAGGRYRYTNAGYVLLGMVVERVSGRNFDDFLRARIFDPLAMNQTRPVAARPKGATKGDGGIASTIDDLLTWDQALATGKLVSAKTLAESLVPARVDEGTNTYAFGWNVAPKNGDTYMWHSGNSGGHRAFLGRLVRERIAIVILTRGDSRRVEIADAIGDILHNRPYTPPRLSVARKLLSVIPDKGVDAALALYHQLRSTAGAEYDFGEAELNGLGYAMLGRGDAAGAIRIFEVNTQQFPKSSNVFDSLGEALVRAGRRAEAVKAYSRAIELDPGNVNARSMLEKLK
jgi:CubicO group peptidase (beta-lactamase class C family)